MKAEITIIGISKYGNTMFETQAEIIVSGKTKFCKQWSIHHTLKEAEDYRDMFNAL